jgi:hypothetical protein
MYGLCPFFPVCGDIIWHGGYTIQVHNGIFLDGSHSRGGSMLEVNLYFGWIWITAGFVSGAILGLFFYDPAWLGGYDSWRRRMVRLGHIAFIGTGLLNVAFVFTFAGRASHSPPPIASCLFVVGATTMPLVCFLSAWRDGFRFLFPVPVASLIGAGLSLVVQGLL